jgi:uncharacterized protein (DUF1800 family)
MAPRYARRMHPRTALALARFGLGRRPAEDVPDDPASWLAAQLGVPSPAAAPPVPGAAEGLLALREDRAALRAGLAGGAARALLHQGATATMAVLLDTTTPLRERLVWLWANHFSVSRRRPMLAPLVFPYVQEAIRPHVTGRFADMLLAVARHPAMLLYLDAAVSIGPDSPVGQRHRRGLNENFARECLELHTVGRDAGYTQADVTAFAEVLTGWSIDRDAATPGFAFFPARHQPGAKIVMGQRVAEGEEGGVALLRWLGTHPATYRRLAAMLARHFIADAPPPDAVGRIAGVLNASGGDLGAAMRAVLAEPAAWQGPGKLRTPFDYAVAVLRALDLPQERRPHLLAVTAVLGQPWLDAPMPDGWSDQAAAWDDGELLLRRADWALTIAGRAEAVEPLDLAAATLGPFCDAPMARALRRAGSRREALALLFAAPAFFRR